MHELLVMLALQGLLGAFDTIYHHELTERLPWRRTAATELRLHGVRNFFYAVLFFSFGWVAWHGVLAWVFGAMLVVEVLITLWDFVEEDRTRMLPASERVTHTILALNYGVILAMFFPVWVEWMHAPTAFAAMDHGWLSWVMSAYGAAVLLWAVRDYSRSITLTKRTPKPLPLGQATLRKRILVTGGTGFLGKPLCQTLLDQGHHLTILTRNKAQAGLFQGRVEMVDRIDALRDNDVFDAVINLAGEPISQRWSKATKAKILSSRLSTTEALVAYLTRVKHKPEVMISGSAIGVYGTSEQGAFAEDTAPVASAEGAFPREVCQRWEDAAQPVEALGIRLCLIRTGLVLESDGGALAAMLFPFEFGIGGPMGHGRQWMSWIHRDDWIALVLHALENKMLLGPINAVAPKAATSREFARALGKALGRPAILPLPAFQVKLLFGEMGQALLLAGQKVLPVKAQSAGFVFRYPTLDGALKAIFD